jgi:hypothetical protein
MVTDVEFLLDLRRESVPVGGAGPRPGTAPLHRRRVRREGPRENRHIRRRVHHRQAAYDLRKLCGKELVDKPARTRRYRVSALAAGSIAALLKVIAPILAGIRTPRMGRKPKGWTSTDRVYEQIQVNIQTLFGVALTTPAALAA